MADHSKLTTYGTAVVAGVVLLWLRDSNRRRLTRPAPDVDSTYLNDYRRQLSEVAQDASRDFDRTVLTLAGGSLVLSVAFVGDLVPDPEFVGVLQGAWACFGAALLAILISYLTSQHGLQKQIADVDLEITDPDHAWTQQTSGMTRALNYGAASLVFAGMAFLIVFALINYGE